MAEFLFEIGLEEVPARMIAGAEAELQRRVLDLLKRERLLAEDAAAQSYSTPRRLAVLVQGVLAKQADLQEELLGPSLKVAFKDGAPTPAAEAFAKKAGVAVSELKTVTNAKGEYIGATVKRVGRAAAEVIAAELPKEIAGLYWAKNMYWRAGKPERFVRPVKWLLALLDSDVVPVQFADVTAANVTYGHRILYGLAPVAVGKPAEYLSALEKAYVLADVAARKQKIRKALDHVTRTVPGARWREDEELVDTVLHLTEWPSVLLGNFEPEYLTLPEEVLVTVMRDHQKYFAVEDAQGKLAPHFLAVLNTEADEAGMAVIRHGNERVLRARFNDARFFWDVDQKIPLTERVEMLKSVTFQKDLGSYYAKAKRIQEIWYPLVHTPENQYQIPPVVRNVDDGALRQAVELCKSDLTCELVKEFTELQGIVGGLYAEAQSLGKAVATAIYDQYKPVSAEDGIPRTLEGCLLSMADKLDTIAGMFAIGLEPTGSKDPFALRRAGNGVIKILAEWPVDQARGIRFISKCAISPYGNTIDYLEDKGKAPAQNWEELRNNVQSVQIPVNQNQVADRVCRFLQERLEFYLRDVKGQAYDVVKAVLAADADDVKDAVARAEAVTQVRGSEDFTAISAAFKRMKNILTQAKEKGDQPADSVNASLLQDATEQALEKKSVALAVQVEQLRQKKEYVAALEAIATLRPQVDAFFDAVMVMAPEKEIRANRLALLARVLGDFSRIADFSEIVTAG
ncbi:MAG: glycine--tRNA ligase subunit beta [Acidobacteriaceae bacterium]